MRSVSMASSMTGGRTGSAASGLAAMAPRRSFLANWPIRRRCTDCWSRSATSDCAWSRYAGWMLAEPETRPGPRDQRSQPAAEVVDAVGTDVAKPRPGVLDGVVGLGCRTEHPVGRRPQTGTVRLELLRQPVLFAHWSHSLVKFRHIRVSNQTALM